MATSETSCSADHDLSLGDAASLSGMDCDTSEASPYPFYDCPKWQGDPEGRVRDLLPEALNGRREV